MMPTCLDLAGIAPVDSVDGESIAPFLRGESDDTCETIFSERQEWCMIVSGDWKLVAQREAQGLEPSMMINLAEDPYELQNRVEDEALAERRAAMLERLVTWDRDVRNLLK